jgi:signal peptidase II
MSEICREGCFKKVKSNHLVLLIGFSVLILDQMTKFFTYKYLPLLESHYYSYPYGGIGVFKEFLGIEFSLNYMANKGAAWGVLGDYQIPLLILRVGLIFGLLVYFFKNKTPSILQIPLVLIIAGAVGNVLDYFIYGHVIDMFHFVLWGYDFPVFNVADSAISIGIGLLFLLSWIYL